MQKKMFVIRVLGHSPFEEKKKKDELAFFCPVVPFPPPLLFPRPFKLLCKKCSLIGVRACVLPRLRESVCPGGNDSWLAPPPRCGGGALLHPPDSPEACPRPRASRSEIVHRNLLEMPRPHHHPVQLSPPLRGGDSPRVSSRFSALLPRSSLPAEPFPCGGSSNNNNNN